MIVCLPHVPVPIITSKNVVLYYQLISLKMPGIDLIRNLLTIIQDFPVPVEFLRVNGVGRIDICYIRTDTLNQPFHYYTGKCIISFVGMISVSTFY